MSQYTAWFETDMVSESPMDGYAVALAATEFDSAIRESQWLLIREVGLGRRAGFRIFDDFEGRLVEEQRLIIC